MKQDWQFLLVGVFGLVMGVFFGCMAGCDAGISHEQKRAIKAGVGRWEIDPETGAKSFRYGP